MAVRARGDITDALSGKGFSSNNTGHHVFFVFLDPNGQKTSVITKVSHGRRSETIGSGLIGKMARQCRLSKKDFLDLVDCGLDEEGYRKKLDTKGSK